MADAIYLIANGDLRLSANRNCWAAQQKAEEAIMAAIRREGREIQRAHAYDPEKQHGFIDSQKYGNQVFRNIPADAPLVVCEAVWQYSHHVLPGLVGHQGPILTVANWSGQWPGLVGMLNLNGCLTKAGVKYSTLWSEDFTDDLFLSGLRQWLGGKPVEHDLSHVRPLEAFTLPADAAATGRELAAQLRRDKAIMGVFDEGCMGMYNAIIPDENLHAHGRLQGAPEPVQPLRRHARRARCRSHARSAAGWMPRACASAPAPIPKPNSPTTRSWTSARCTSPPCASPTISAAT